MVQPAHRPFVSGIDTKLALSAAFSTQFNARGLEANFTPAWISTLREAFSYSNRLSVATEPCLSISGSSIQRLELCARNFELVKRREELEAKKKGLSGKQAIDAARQSNRIRQNNEAKTAKEELELNNEARDLRRLQRNEWYLPLLS